MVYKRVRVWTSGRSLLIYNFVVYPPLPPWKMGNHDNDDNGNVKKTIKNYWTRLSKLICGTLTNHDILR